MDRRTYKRRMVEPSPNDFGVLYFGHAASMIERLMREGVENPTDTAVWY